MRKISGTGTQITIDLNDAGASVVTLTADWQEFKVENVTHASAATKFIDLSASTATWTTGDTFEVWRPQFNYGATANPFSPVGNVYPFHGACVDGVKCFDYENPNIVVNNVVQEITGVAVPLIPDSVLKGYVPNTAVTNICQYSGDLTNAAWTKVAATASIATYPPRLLKEALPSQLADDSSAASIHGMYQNRTVTANTNYCVWVAVHSSGERFRGRIGFLDSASSSNGVICEFNARTGATNAAAVGTGVLAGSGYLNVAKGWGIVYVSGKIDTAATTAGQIQFLMADSAGNLVYDGDGVSRMILAHFQLETGTVPGQFVPTVGASATYNADVLSYPAAGNVSASGWTVYADFEIDYATDQDRFVCDFTDGTSTERVSLYHGTGQLRIYITDGGVTQATIPLGSIGAGFKGKIAARIAENDIAAVITGGTIATDTSATLPTVTTIHPGRYVGASSQFNSPVKNLRISQQLLTNAELLSLVNGTPVDDKINTLGWVDSPHISHDGRRLYFMYSRYDFMPLLVDGAGVADLVTTGPNRPWHVAIAHPLYDGDVYCAYLRHDGTVERIENLRFDPNYDDFSLQTGSAESSLMEVAATAALPKRVYYNANRATDVPKLVYRQEAASGAWTAETTSELAAVASGGSGSGYIDDNAFVTDDRLGLVFASTRPGGQGSHDLWMSLRAGPTDAWGAPANVGTNVNTAGHEDQVFLHQNGVDVYFTRDGTIWHCTRAGPTLNNDATQITFGGYPFSGAIAEPSVTQDMTTMYFSYASVADRRIRVFKATNTGGPTDWGSPVAVD